MKQYLFYFLLIAHINSYAQSPNWKVNEGAFQHTQTMITRLSYNGITLESGDDMVGAFVGEECRGVAKPVYLPLVDRYLAFLTIFSNTQGEKVTFKLFDSKSKQVINTTTEIQFKINEHIGSTFQSFSIAYPLLSKEAKTLNFSFKNLQIDSVKHFDNATTNKRDSSVFYIPFGVNKSNLAPFFEVSPGANLFFDQKVLKSDSTKINFGNNVLFQIRSADESVLNDYKVRVVNAISGVLCNDSIALSKPTFTFSKNTLCQGDTIEVFVNNINNNDSIIWTINNVIDQTQSLTRKIYSSTTFSVIKKRTAICLINSDTISIISKAKPATPTISRNSQGFLTSSSQFNNNWYKDTLKLSDTLNSIKPLQQGFYKVRIIDNGCSSQFSSNYFYLLTDIINLENNQFLKIGPNPFMGNLRIDFNLKNDLFVDVEIRSLQNGQIMHLQKNVYPGSQINLSHLSSGIYICTLYYRNQKEKVQIKIIKV